MKNEQRFVEEMRYISAAVHLKCQFDEVAKILNEMRQSRLIEMKDATKIVEMRLELESLVNRAAGPIIAKGPAGL